MKLGKSLEYLARAEKVIPTCSQTFSKSWRYFPKGAAPVYLKGGYGSRVYDVDGNVYTDYILGLGPITLGYCYPKVDEAILDQLSSGIILSLPHPLEVELSELLVNIIPCADMVRFSKTGSEVTSAAIKAARAYTNREHIAQFGYHGWHDWYTAKTNRSKGIPLVYDSLVHTFEYNDLDSLRAIFDLYPDQVAAVIMEPTVIVSPLSNFLSQVRELTHQNGAVLIFDEIVTGFRWHLGGAQTYFRVIPDMATFGKGMANGMPLNCVVGRADIMKMYDWEGEVFFSTTFGGECLSLAAGLATINEMGEKGTINHCWNLGHKLIKGLSDLDIEVIGFPCRPFISHPFTEKEKTFVIQELIKRGLLVHSGFLINLCYSHTFFDIDMLLNAFEDIMKLISNNKISLEGEIVQSAFRRT